MMRARVYLLPAVIGAALPYSQFVPWVLENGLDLQVFVRELFANRISAFFGLDVAVSAVALAVFVGFEGSALPARHRGAVIAGMLLIGVLFALPLFLRLREQASPSLTTTPSA